MKKEVQFKTHEDMVTMLLKRFPHGVTLYTKPETIENLKGYMFRRLDEPFICKFSQYKNENDENKLNACFKLKPEQYRYIYPSSVKYENKELQDKMGSIEDAAVSLFLHTNTTRKELQNAEMELSDGEVLNSLYLENLHYNHVISVALQNNDVTEKDIKQLSKLRQNVKDMPGEEVYPQSYMGAIQQIQYGRDYAERSRYLTENKNSTVNLHFIPMPGRGVICFEKGTLGYVHIANSRIICAYGDNLHKVNRDQIMSIAQKENFIGNEKELALYPIGRNKLFYDARREKVFSLNSQVIDGKEVLSNGIFIIPKKDEWLDITGRYERPSVYKAANNEWRVRCKIDGEWKASKKVDAKDSKLLDNSLCVDAVSLAAKYYLKELTQSPKDERNVGRTI